ncbi:MAG: hypothetical protein NZ826_07055 [Thermodesulfovibrio sp.]|nr:hypothetical protein [Thermodesulfovibrio sp.]
MKKLILLIFPLCFIFALASSSFSINDLNDTSSSCKITSENTLFAASANCGPWNLQPDGCYERVCCCDSNGQHWCERCCPDKTGKCVAYKVKC